MLLQSRSAFFLDIIFRGEKGPKDIELCHVSTKQARSVCSPNSVALLFFLCLKLTSRDAVDGYLGILSDH